LKAVVLAPKPLVEQWKSELEEKFRVSDFGSRIYLGSTEALLKLSQLDGTHTVGMTIVDEAHHIAAGAYSEDPVLRKRFAACQQLASCSDRLLLLSATPVLNNEKDFLAMLHLLDPVTYRLDDFDAFRDRVNKRQDIGRILLSFREGAAPFVLKTSANNLRGLFPEDRRLHELLDELQQSLTPDATDVNKPDGIVRSIRTHISDTYRLHRRMLRNRRESVQLVSRLNVARAAVELKEEYDDDERGIEIHELLDEWRVRAFNEVLSIAGDDGEDIKYREQELQRLFIMLFRAAGTWLGILKKVAEVRLSLAPESSLARDFSTDDLRVLRESPMFDCEDDILRAILDVLNKPAGGGDCVQLLVDMLRRLQASQAKVVVFTSFVGTHREILSRLKAEYGDTAVASHDSDRLRVEVEEDVKRFREDPNCFVLVIDSSGEEGRNFQFADWLIHFDLPWSPNRLEQRIGRLDRIGRNRSVQTRILLGSESPNGDVTIFEAWYRFLKEGLGVFENSIASLQFYIEEKLPMLERAIFRSGSQGLLEMIEATGEEIKVEQLKIREQNALDEIDALEKNAAQYFDLLVDYDAQHERIRKSTEDWICEVLHFNRNRTSGVVRYSPRPATLVPSNLFLEFFAPALSTPGTYERSIASKRSDVKLYRIGEQFTDALAHYVRWDDRGQAFAMWRHDPRWSGEEGSEWIGFRFNYVVEADLTAVKDALTKHCLLVVGSRALSRRADALFPPFTHTIYLDASMRGVIESEDAELLEILRRPYSKKPTPTHDYSLDDERLPILDRLIGFDAWPSLCREARSRSEVLLRNRQSFRDACEKLAASAEQELAKRLDQLSLRLERETGVSASTLSRDLAIERAFSTAIMSGIRNPQLRLDSVGLIVVSGNAPSI
jgi:ATP-dependent helicase HepA